MISVNVEPKLNKQANITIAIDGPSASGKSTVSRRVAEELGFIYVDSGSLYRGMTWKMLREGIPVTNTEAVIERMSTTQWVFLIRDNVVGFRIDDEDPGMDIRSEPVRENVSDVAAIPEVRAFIVERLREMVEFGPIVMEGRDIGTVVFPETPYKYYLDADPEERARRRTKDLEVSEGCGDVDKVLDSLNRRDQKDTNRKTAPLQIALGAAVIDTTHMDFEDVVNSILKDLCAFGISG